MFGITTTGKAACLRATASAHSEDDYGMRCLYEVLCKPDGKREREARKVMNIGPAMPKAMAKRKTKRKRSGAKDIAGPSARPTKMLKSCLRAKTGATNMGGKTVRFEPQIVSAGKQLGGSSSEPQLWFWCGSVSCGLLCRKCVYRSGLPMDVDRYEDEDIPFTILSAAESLKRITSAVI